MGITTYSPSAGRPAAQGDIWGGLMGAKLDEPIAYPGCRSTTCRRAITAVWVGQGNADGSFHDRQRAAPATIS